MNYQGNNPEGYPDPTANQAVGIVSREEKEAAKAKNLQHYVEQQIELLTKYEEDNDTMGPSEIANR